MELRGKGISGKKKGKEREGKGNGLSDGVGVLGDGLDEPGSGASGCLEARTGFHRVPSEVGRSGNAGVGYLLPEVLSYVAYPYIVSVETESPRVPQTPVVDFRGISVRKWISCNFLFFF